MSRKRPNDKTIDQLTDKELLFRLMPPTSDPRLLDLRREVLRRMGNGRILRKQSVDLPIEIRRLVRSQVTEAVNIAHKELLSKAAVISNAAESLSRKSLKPK